MTTQSGNSTKRPRWLRLLHKVRLGRHFSEGARRLWLFLAEREWSQGDLAREIATAKDGRGDYSALVNRWLYGGRRPSLEHALLLKKIAGIDPSLWTELSAEPFTPPAAQGPSGAEGLTIDRPDPPPDDSAPDETGREQNSKAVDGGDISSPALDGNVGHSLRAVEDKMLPARTGPVYVRTGVRLKVPEGVLIRLIALASTIRRGILVPEVGIDSGDTGELLVACFNFTANAIRIEAGARLAQIVCFPVITPPLAFVEELPQMGREEDS